MSMTFFVKKIDKKICLFTCISMLFVSSAFIFADTVHTVAAGETLYAISRKYQITVAELRIANNMSENDVLKAGQKLTIPAADISSAAALSASPVPADSNTRQRATQTYTVKKGDTFYGIAKKHDISLSELFSLNNIGSDAVLKAGQKIKVPAPSSNSSVVAKSEELPKNKDETQKSSASAAGKEEKTKLPDLKAADPRTYRQGNSTDSQLVWPVKNPKVTYVKGKVGGVQLSCQKDETVSAIMAGTIMYCGIYRGFGQVIFVQSKTGLIYAYTGLSTVEIKKGDYVVAGTALGTAGVDTITYQPQITLMVFQNGMPIDPAKAPRG